ncbi:MAG: NADH-quinone oxidoreductase subunit J [Bacteroidetes bacterium]|nr:NADH-quinone oxidoreductase subunit J [Bacteroidota bacterium]MBK9526406.1 NADH-quinone oxidoreductase subunit J [Bacteroidota bacterium]MBK9544015.1 NADH-quinone oxidoreductase subunit J [Bacteroidota bacterium]MBP6400973.1 NADH-quinone oxidoreductase subunit J [Bacteroidia bacterium]MBP6648440.1 NADH-quinone oxidoreductase subunit J [Bacteroidia bacterium]
MTLYLFYFLSFLAILCALMVVVSKNPVHSVLYLILTFFAIAGHYVLLNAQFLAAVHVIVYAGAIMVLFLYVIMMLNLNAETEPQKGKWLRVAATMAGGLLMVVLVGALRSAADTISLPVQDSQIGMIKNLGRVLYKDFMLPFEISSILFLSAMVGAVMLGKKEIK